MECYVYIMMMMMIYTEAARLSGGFDFLLFFRERQYYTCSIIPPLLQSSASSYNYLLTYKTTAVQAFSSLSKLSKTFLFSIPKCYNVYKYNTSVDNITFYLYTKIVYLVRATCFDLIRSSSGLPRRQIKESLGSVFLEGLTKYTIFVYK